MNILLSFLVNAAALWLTAKYLPGVEVASYTVALIVVFFIAFFNAWLKPLLILMTLPVNILTLGLFTFVINAFILFMVSQILDGFEIQNFVTALVFAVVLAFVNGFFNILIGEKP